MKKTTGRRSAHRWLALAALVVVIAAVSLLWRFTSLAEVLSPDRVAALLERIEGSKWAPLIFLAAFIVGGFILFPVTVLSAATAITFPPLKAAPISFAGIMLSAALMHWLGARLLKKHGRKMFGKTVGKLTEVLHDKGVLAVASLRMMPIAPFTLVNVAAGAVGISFRDYMLGSALGLAPGLTMMVLFGRQVRTFWKDPSVSGVLIVAAVVIVWAAMSLVLQRWSSRRSGKSAQ
jgi:phospholipase D1/2